MLLPRSISSPRQWATEIIFPCNDGEKKKKHLDSMKSRIPGFLAHQASLVLALGSEVTYWIQLVPGYLHRAQPKTV